LSVAQQGLAYCLKRHTELKRDRRNNGGILGSRIGTAAGLAIADKNLGDAAIRKLADRGNVSEAAALKGELLLAYGSEGGCGARSWAAPSV
jgi:hypothetical protein